MVIYVHLNTHLHTVHIENMSSTVRVSVADQQLRQFKLGLQALARIGHELLIEALPNKVMRQR